MSTIVLTIYMYDVFVLLRKVMKIRQKELYPINFVVVWNIVDEISFRLKSSLEFFSVRKCNNIFVVGLYTFVRSFITYLRQHKDCWSFYKSLFYASMWHDCEATQSRKPYKNITSRWHNQGNYWRCAGPRENRSKVTKANLRRPRGCTDGVSRLSLSIKRPWLFPVFVPVAVTYASRTRKNLCRRPAAPGAATGSFGRKYRTSGEIRLRTGERTAKWEEWKRGIAEYPRVEGCKVERGNGRGRDALPLGTCTHFPLPALSNPDCHGRLVWLLFTSDDE